MQFAIYGVFVSGQSLFAEPAGLLTGKLADYEMPNYQDFPAIVRALTRLSDAGRPLLCLTGDVHQGRVTEAHDLQRYFSFFVVFVFSLAERKNENR